MSTPPPPNTEPETPGEGTEDAGESLASVVHVARDEGVDAICGRIDGAPTFAVILHAPRGNGAIASELGMRRLTRHVEDAGRTVAIATGSRGLAARAREMEVPVARRPEHVRWDAGGRRVARIGSRSLALPRFGKAPQIGVFVLAVLLAGALLIGLAPTATVTVYASAEPVERVVTVTASTEQEGVDLETLAVPATTVTAERTFVLAVPATGTITTGAVRATTGLEITNPTGEVVVVPAGAVVSTASGSASFALDTEVAVGAGGSAAATATATAPGAGANVAAGALTVWRDAQLATLSVTNPEAASGGAGEVVPAVAAEDIVALRALVDALPEDRAFASLLAAARPGAALLLETAEITVEEGPPSAATGEQATTLFIEVTATITALAVPADAIVELAEALLLDDRRALIPGSVTATETGARRLDREGGTFQTDLLIRAEAVEGVDRGSIRDAVKGKRVSSARASLAQRDIDYDVDIEKPAWAPLLPYFGFRIDVEFASRATADTTVPGDGAEPAARP